MTECWINVYRCGLGVEYKDESDAVTIAKVIRKVCVSKDWPLYRLHVKLKPLT